MNTPPRDPKSHIMNKKFVTHFVLLGIYMGIVTICVYIYDLYSQGWTWQMQIERDGYMQMHASTIAFATLVIIQLVNAFNARSATTSIFRLKPNFYLIGAVCISLLMVISIVYVPFIQAKTSVVALDQSDWIIVILASLSVLVVEETRKFIIKKQ